MARLDLGEPVVVFDFGKKDRQRVGQRVAVRLRDRPGELQFRFQLKSHANGGEKTPIEFDDVRIGDGVVMDLPADAVEQVFNAGVGLFNHLQT